MSNTSTEAVVQTNPDSGVYKESDEHVPDPTHAFGTLDTSGTAGAQNERIENISPIFDAARAQDLQRAKRAVDPDDHEVPESEVVLSTGVTTVAGDPDADRDRVRRVADSYEKDPVKVQDPSLTSAKDNAETTQGESRGETATRVQSEQQQGTPTGGVKTDTSDNSGARLGLDADQK